MVETTKKLCKGVTLGGEPCGAYPMPGTPYCSHHQPDKPARRWYSPEEKLAICRAYLLGNKTQAELSSELGLSKGTISRITNEFKHQQWRRGRDPEEVLAERSLAERPEPMNHPPERLYERDADPEPVAILKVAHGIWEPLYAPWHST